ncbi:MAG: hypothetical protein ACR2LC_01370 [Pyrinomonadaceae bacterium]
MHNINPSPVIIDKHILATRRRSGEALPNEYARAFTLVAAALYACL